MTIYHEEMVDSARKDQFAVVWRLFWSIKDRASANF